MVSHVPLAVADMICGRYRCHSQWALSSQSWVDQTVRSFGLNRSIISPFTACFRFPIPWNSGKSASHCPIVMKFDMLVHYVSAEPGLVIKAEND